MDFSSYYEEVYSQDHLKDGPHGWIQWKGTNVCMDLHCTCGHHGHIDGEFFYHYKCPKCGAKFAVGQVVKLIPLTEEQISHVESGGGCQFQTCDLED